MHRVLHRALAALALVSLAIPSPAQKPLRTATGERHVLAILWDPHRPDHPAPPVAEIESMLFGPKPSVRDFYAENSRGKLTVVSAGTLGWFDALHPWELYWRASPYSVEDAVGTSHEYVDPDGKPRYLDDEGFYGGHSHKWAEAVRLADASFDYAQYDRDKDGKLAPDELVILMIIPQKSSFGTRRPVVGRHVPPQPLIVDGVVVSQITEAYISSKADLGVVAHELAHGFLDAPDQYFQCSSGGFSHPYAAGSFSLMDKHGRHPHFDPAQKAFYGWLTPSVVDLDGPLVLHNVEETGQVFRLSRHGHGDREYFLLENRWAGDSYDAGPVGANKPLPDQGLAIWHVIEDVELSKKIYDKTGVDESKLPCVWNDWARRGIRLIRPVRGSASNWTALWDGEDPATGYDISAYPDPAHPDRIILRWADGVPSGYEISDLSKADASMTFTLRVPTRVSLKSVQSGKVVRAGVTATSLLAAASNHMKGWERFRVLRLGGRRVALVSEQSGKIVRAGVGKNAQLAAVSDRIGGWETFEVVDRGQGRVALRSVQNGKFVRAGVGQQSYLAAVSDRVAGWETFEWVATAQPPQ